MEENYKKFLEKKAADDKEKIRRELVLSYNPIVGNEGRITKELEARYVAALLIHKEYTEPQKKKLKEDLKIALDKEIADGLACVTTLTEPEIRARKAEIRKAIEAEIGLSMHDEAMMMREIDLRFRAETLDKCAKTLICAEPVDEEVEHVVSKK